MDLIPQDVWPLIASFLEDKTKRLMRLASIKWFSIIKYNNFNLYFTRKEYIPAITDRLSKYSWPIKLTFSKSKFNDLLDAIGHLQKLTNLIELKSDSMNTETEHVTLEQWMQLSVLTNLQAWRAYGDVPLELWNEFVNLTVWSRSEPEEILAPILKRMSNLKKLNFFDDTQTWPFALVPNPEKLSLLHMSAQQTIVHGGEWWSRLTNLRDFEYSEDDNVSNALNLQYLTSLEYLSLSNGRSTLPSLASNTNLTRLYLFCKRWSLSNAEALGSLTKLEEIYFDIPPETDYPLQFQFLAHLPQLTTLTFRNDYNATINFDDLNDTLYKYIPQQVRTISTSIECIFISQLTHLTNLESLDCNQIANGEHLSLLSNIMLLFIRSVSDNQDLSCVGKLTRLQDLFLDVDGPIGLIDESKQPDVSQLVHLTSLYWGYRNYEMSKILQMKYLTKLQDLTIGPNDLELSIENCDFLAGLSNLTSLKIECSVLKEDSFWQNVIRLTNINTLDIHEVDHDDRLLLLTSLTKLTSLEIRSGSQSITGVHFTALTSLQSIYYFGDGTNLAHKKEDILKSMPYLICYSYFIPLI